VSLPVPIIALLLGSALPDSRATCTWPRVERTAQWMCEWTLCKKTVFLVTSARPSFLRKWLPISSHPLALAGQVVGRDDLDRDGSRRLDRQRTALLQDQPHRETRVDTQIVVQHHRDAAVAQQPPVVGVEVVCDKQADKADRAVRPRRPWRCCRHRRSRRGTE